MVIINCVIILRISTQSCFTHLFFKKFFLSLSIAWYKYKFLPLLLREALEPWHQGAVLMVASGLESPIAWYSFSNSATHGHVTVGLRFPDPASEMGWRPSFQGTDQNVQPLVFPLTHTFCISYSLIYPLPVDLHPKPSGTSCKDVLCIFNTFQMNLLSSHRDAVFLQLGSLQWGLLFLFQSTLP